MEEGQGQTEESGGQMKTFGLETLLVLVRL